MTTKNRNKLMLSILISIIGILITIFLVIGVHEFGHFIVAKKSGIKVLRFSIGFGKPLLTWHDKQKTEYVLAAIPLGGYVKMLDENEGDVPPEELHLTFNRQPFYKKIAVIAAGPLFNLLFALIIYWFLFIVGFVSIVPIIGSVTPNSIAAESGLKAKQEIVKIDNKVILNWTTAIITLLSHAGDKEKITMQLKNPDSDQVQQYFLDVNKWHMDELKPDPLDSLGIIPYDPEIPPVIGKILAKSPADSAGLKVGDKIIEVNGKPIKDWYDIVVITSAHPNENLPITLMRGTEKISLPVSIGYKRNLFFMKQGFLGMMPAFEWPEKLLRKNQYSVFAAFPHAWQDVMTFANMNFIIIGKMITGKISLKSLGGPITIFETAGTALNNGILAFLSFLAFLSISIGIINIIPIPGLDGGHLLFQTIETIIRRPIPERTLVLFYRFGMLFLLIIMIQALVNDVLRL
jgi:regulator of sigma E protease